MRDNGYEPKIIEYLKTPPNVKELRKICNVLQLRPIDIIRKREKEYNESNISKLYRNEDLLEEIVKHPKLMERPIVIKGEKGIIGRPPENVLKLL